MRAEGRTDGRHGVDRHHALQQHLPLPTGHRPCSDRLRGGLYSVIRQWRGLARPWRRPRGCSGMRVPLPCLRQGEQCAHVRRWRDSVNGALQLEPSQLILKPPVERPPAPLPQPQAREPGPGMAVGVAHEGMLYGSPGPQLLSAPLRNNSSNR